MKCSGFIALAFLGLILTGTACSKVAERNNVITQLTDNNYDDIGPQIDNRQVVWQDYDGNDYEVFLWDGDSIRQLTDNNYDDENPQVDAGQIVWWGFDGYDYKIFLHDRGLTRQLYL